MITVKTAATGLAASLMAATLAGCHYVKQDNFDASMAQLRGNDASMRSDIDGLQMQMSSLTRDLDAKFKQYDGSITQLQGRIRVDMTTHFDYAKAALRDDDKPVLDDFAEVIRDHHPDVMITVEGFTDPAGSPSYNRRLGQRRADAVREYLVSSGGLDASKIRAVSYGEDRKRQVQPGAWGEGGVDNRRVALVIDYAGSPQTAPM